ncbi:hypothetical protein Goshw_016769 [Gossypium schwendimanii]|uniref:PGG domain-containing protein n=1 Tax=Gossypium schwendimanii TaxID=34291 RepID=A0A7J9NB75_GOSSC|nr:hypothetical protein [Gossypium schwendimanii]
MRNAAQEGDINVLYELIQNDQYVLERIDHVPFLDTPLHVAASAGHIEILSYMVEMMNLKPSLARKLNQAGFSPMHLALQNHKTQAVLRLLRFDEGLVRVEGREGLTPLHHVVQNGNVDFLIKFLEVCPEAIEDVTVRDETKELLSWADSDGNIVLHAAAIRNRPQTKSMPKIWRGLTALDIQSQYPRNEMQADRIVDMLSKAGGLSGSASSLPNTAISSFHIKSLKEKVSVFQKIATIASRGKKGIPYEMRNTFLVVTVLIITATYTATLSPPKKPDRILTSSNYQLKYHTSLDSKSTAPEPSPTTDEQDLINLVDVSTMFWLYNTLTFWAATVLTAYLLPSRSICLFILITLSLFGTCYMLLVAVSIWTLALQYIFYLPTAVFGSLDF